MLNNRAGRQAVLIILVSLLVAGFVQDVHSLTCGMYAGGATTRNAPYVEASNPNINQNNFETRVFYFVPAYPARKILSLEKHSGQRLSEVYRGIQFL
jgi:hypothetical protein